MAILAVMLVSCAASSPKSNSQQAIAGVLDLRTWNFQADGNVPLVGEWQFLPGETGETGSFRHVPDTWNSAEAGGQNGHGIARYRLHILLPASHPELGLRYTTVATAFRLVVNGQAIAQVGSPAAEASQSVPAYRPGTIALVNFGPTLDLEVLVANHEYRVGGLWRPISLGIDRQLVADRLHGNQVSLIMMSALVVVGLGSLLLFSFRPQEQSTLFNGLFALIIALRSVVTGDYLIVQLFPGLNFDLLIRLEYLTVFLPIGVAVRYYAVQFPGTVRRWELRLFSWPSWLFTSFILCLPLDLLTRTLPAYYPVAALTLCWLFIILVIRIPKIKRSPRPLLLGALVLFLAALNDMLYAAFIVSSGNLLPYALGIFSLVQSILLAQRFTQSFSQVEHLLAEKNLLIKEIHHRVKNSLQVVASLLSLQANRSSDPVLIDSFNVMKQRIGAMSLVHEKLYGLVQTDVLDLGAYLRDLVPLLVKANGIDPSWVQVDLVAPTVLVKLDICIDAGLIVTELISNACKYALQPETPGSIKLSLESGPHFMSLSIVDSGPGFPEGFRPETGNSLGYKVISALLKRNYGSLEIAPGPGAAIKVTLGLGLDDSA